ncbi:MAG: glutamine--fructose-6-phosphate transaminase (isomerizing) [Candidatus Hydrogenedentales bacterium]
MCGIVGYLGPRMARDVLLEGLRRLEYRGYDSAGVAVIEGKRLVIEKAAGKLKELETKLRAHPLSGHIGIGHTRWATHGPATDANAHPHCDASGRIAVVHNGIIENYQALRAQLIARGVTFRSDTDTEVLPHLIAQFYKGDLLAAVRAALREVRGAYAIAVVHADHPDLLIAARQGSPLAVGLGEGECFLASDVSALLPYTRKVVYLENGQVCELHAGVCRIQTLDGSACAAPETTIEWDATAADKAGYPHYMLKEIYQQPDVVRVLLQERIAADDVGLRFPDKLPDEARLRRCTKATIVACGTAAHAGMIGGRYLEQFVRLPAQVDIASEFRYRDPLIDADTLVIAVSQSGETADTLEAMRLAKERGAYTVAIVNAVGSSAAREADHVFYTQAGPEIGVASTKAYTAQITAFALWALYIGRLRDVLKPADVAAYLAELRRIPEKLTQCIERNGAIARVAEKPKYCQPKSAFFMGRGYNVASALEGALKLKEISYIHAEGYPAGEMKHGPLALITDEVPMIGIATQCAVYEKMISNLQEIRARRGIVLAIATDDDTGIEAHSEDQIYVPACPDPFSPLLVAVPLQLFAYHVAVNRGCDVDQPRNLAKSVTVE